jgi:hypothetical protein
MTDSDLQSSIILECRRTVLIWTAIGAVAAIMLGAWAEVTNFPEHPPAWARNLPLLPITLALMAASSPALLMRTLLNPFASWFSVSEGIEEAIYNTTFVIVNAGAYALIGVLACLVRRISRSDP